MVARVLVAEDDAHSLVLMLHVLKARGYLTSFATDGDEALRLTREEKPDLVICKWRLSRSVDGRRVAQQLRREEPLRSIPLLAIFDASPQVVGGRATPAGFDGYVATPVEPESFIATVELHIPAHQRPARLPVRLRGQRRKTDATPE
jgi:CheY-like chemotaxis protein